MECKRGDIYEVKERMYDKVNEINVYWLRNEGGHTWAEDMLWPVEEVSLLDIIQEGEANG